VGPIDECDGDDLFEPDLVMVCEDGSTFRMHAAVLGRASKPLRPALALAVKGAGELKLEDDGPTWGLALQWIDPAAASRPAVTWVGAVKQIRKQSQTVCVCYMRPVLN
jgi:hypothetical protein